MTRDEAWSILCEYTKNENLRKHALAVEACVVAYAGKFGGDREQWSVVALLHDFDYEIYPEVPDHAVKGEAILIEKGVDAVIRRAILSHASYSGVTRESPLEKTLFACDELAGFLTAVSLVKPNKSIFEVDAKSVRKKMKDKAFARSVNREDIVQGSAELGVDLDEHIAFCAKAMQAQADALGLRGTFVPEAGSVG
jgi:putative nucleotidyltransferase with HDIG domain